ncbi:sensor histidine kinase [Amycolatopsis samaneae]|uniref:histidine kinase n=1 Tax=Amycolatopsis samaneae TaxID=664691 RepID=A0ABW5G9S4_9PSEU
MQDSMLAALLCAAWWVWLLSGHAENDLPLRMAVAGACTLPLALRRRAPLLSWAVVLVAAMVVAWWNVSNAVGDIPTLLAVYSAGNHLAGRPQAATGLLTLAWSQSIPLLQGQTGTASPFVGGLLLFGTAWLLGAQHRRTRQLTGQLRLEQEMNAQRAVISERSRIARDLHDAVAHHISAISVHAYAASEALDRDSAVAKASLGHVGAASRAVISEARWIVGLLDSEDDHRVQPSLREVDRLTEPIRAIGGEVTITVAPAALRLPETAQTAVYRILQEALTNVVKHVGPVRVRVTVERSGGELRVEVVNARGATRARRDAKAGRGLVGMRERAALFSGTLDAGPLPDGGYRVKAVLEVEEP